MGFRGLFELPGIEPGLVRCKTITLLTVISLWPHIGIFFNKKYVSKFRNVKGLITYFPRRTMILYKKNY